ncbi:hypothetical protein PTW37_16325 (plasmid) [Arthrobacter agilis]|uniref:hypothetical protein n=1 Tax=Arthrobacter agilis TaxID=37921 RepID=UPI00236503D5|nr:hypothetical protein [Arthrobacter agilis]WDF35070.1 hypothetical protein PTW37_16325 [Arthrobacter agilis]
MSISPPPPPMVPDPRTPEGRQQMIQAAQDGSLARSALIAWDKEETAREEEALSDVQREDRLREKYAAEQAATFQDTVTAALSAMLKVPTDDPRLANLRWHLSAEALQRMTFIDAEQGVIAGGGKSNFDLFAEVVPGLYIRASSYQAGEQPYFRLTSSPTSSQAAPFSTFAELGRAIGRLTT